MSTINKQAVVEMYNNYHRKVLSNPTLYTNQRDGNYGILVPLPKELLDYAERSAGHHGFGQNAAPVGIRRTVSDAKATLKEIFSSPANLEKFILSSACDAEAYMAEVRERHANSPKAQIISVDPLDRPISEFNLEQLYGKGTIAHLRNTYPKTALEEFRILTRREYEARYELTAVEQSVATV